jgi:hypothetical protein
LRAGFDVNATGVDTEEDYLAALRLDLNAPHT